MAVDVVYPKVSLETDSGRISRWLVAEGEAVTPGQILFEIENEKASVEVESPAGGIISLRVPDPDTEVAVGRTVAVIYAAGETPLPVSSASGADTEPEPGAEAPADGGTGTDTDTRAKDQREAAAGSGADYGPLATAPRRAGGPLPTPLARRMARDAGITLEGIPGTGPGGRVQRKDVLALLARPALGLGSGGLHAVWLRRGESAPLVLLHGFAGDHGSWRPMIAGTRTDRPVLALDLPGHGGSAQVLPPDFDAMADAVAATLAGLDLGRFVLAGHSLGGALAARVATRLPQVRGLCLFAPAGLGPEINGAFLSGILRATRADSLTPWLQMLVSDPGIITPALVRQVEGQRRDQSQTAAMQAIADRVYPDATQAFSVRGDLAGLDIPVRVLSGTDDRILPFAQTRGLPGQVGLHGFQGCGHMPHLEQRATALRLLSEVIRSAGL